MLFLIQTVATKVAVVGEGRGRRRRDRRAPATCEGKEGGTGLARVPGGDANREREKSSARSISPPSPAPPRPASSRTRCRERGSSPGSLAWVERKEREGMSTRRGRRGAREVLNRGDASRHLPHGRRSTLEDKPSGCVELSQALECAREERVSKMHGRGRWCRRGRRVGGGVLDADWGSTGCKDAGWCS